MATLPQTPAGETEDEQPSAPTLTPLAFPEGYIPGRYAAFPVSPEPMYGPDELGEYKSAIKDLDETVTRADSAARLWEVMQAWEARNFSRGYQFMQGTSRGWNMTGAFNGSAAGTAEILQTQNQMKLFPCNVYAAREDKIVSALSRQVPGLTFVPKSDQDPMDQTAADEKKKYLQVWLTEAEISEVLGHIAHLFYTDDRVVLYTGSWADQQAWGTETQKPAPVFDPPEAQGVTPETEQQPADGGEEVPAVREVTRAGGKLEWKVPIYADKQSQMAWMRGSWEENVNTLKERYVWIEEKISAGASVGGTDQLDRQARIAVRLAVQSSSSSGESSQQDATETFTWYRPSQYRAIKDKGIRDLFFQTFPDGLLVVHAGGELAFCRNESMDRHLAIVHPKHGSGQNRRAIGSNYLPLQKVLNANISLIDRYFRSTIPRRFHDAEAIDTEAINGQTNDPAKSTPLALKGGQRIADATGVENVPQPTTGIFEFVQWLIDGAPEAMDGASPAMFGMEDADTFGATKLNRDQALQVLSMPWRRICHGLAKAAEQAADCAAANRISNITFNVPGQDRLQVEIGKMRGEALCYPESLEIPQTIAEQEAQMAQLLENSKNVAIYNAIANDPRNLNVFRKFPSLSGLSIPGLDAVEEQQGEFELLLQSGPIPNPQIAQIEQQIAAAQQHITEGATNPEAQTPQGQAAMQQLQAALPQLQQQMQALPPMVSSVPVAQNGSENHSVHAIVTLGMMNSAEGRKLKYGSTEPGPNGEAAQQDIYKNLMLHWQEHSDMSLKLTPPKEMEFKGSLTVDPSKFSPDVQAKVFQAAGLQVSPEEAAGDDNLSPHEVTTEKEGVDANGVPVKQKISMVGKGLR